MADQAIKGTPLRGFLFSLLHVGDKGMGNENEKEREVDDERLEATASSSETVETGVRETLLRLVTDNLRLRACYSALLNKCPLKIEVEQKAEENRYLHRIIYTLKDQLEVARQQQQPQPQQPQQQQPQQHQQGQGADTEEREAQRLAQELCDARNDYEKRLRDSDKQHVALEETVARLKAELADAKEAARSLTRKVDDLAASLTANEAERAQEESAARQCAQESEQQLREVEAKLGVSVRQLQELQDIHEEMRRTFEEQLRTANASLRRAFDGAKEQAALHKKQMKEANDAYMGFVCDLATLNESCQPPPAWSLQTPPPPPLPHETPQKIVASAALGHGACVAADAAKEHPFSDARSTDEKDTLPDVVSESEKQEYYECPICFALFQAAQTLIEHVDEHVS